MPYKFKADKQKYNHKYYYANRERLLKEKGLKYYIKKMKKIEKSLTGVSPLLLGKK